MERKKELNTRQWALYTYLKSVGDEWTTQYNVATALNRLGGYYPLKDSDLKDFHNSPARHLMTADIRVINDSDVIQKIIISGPKGIKIANKQEFEKYIQKEIHAAVRRLLRAKRKREKGSKDGQYKIPFGPYEREIVEAFTDSKEKEQ